ncbi:MAG TPA: omptin family outer membrane protease, partial [Spirochaetia bacterium]|nr:omptin family outer membrane protease [Spirochaetia bacterium]
MPRKDVCGLVVACALLAGATRPGPVQALPVSLSATSGVLLGGAKEFVYDGSYMLSELDWPILPAVYAGLKMDVGDTSGFLARAELKVGIPLPAGIMTDSDFLNLDGVKTHYSQSDGDIESIILASAQVGWGIPFWIPGVGT